MANLDVTMPLAEQAQAGAAIRPADAPRVRTITTADLRDALYRGWEDFKAQPSHLAFIALVYPIVGALLAQISVSYNVLPLVFPLIGGFALLGPFAAIGLYEISRRRETGEVCAWSHAFAVLKSPNISQIATLGFILVLMFGAWLVSAWLIYRLLLPAAPDATPIAFARAVLGTFDGWVMMIVGNAVGLLFAITAFSISVVAFPLMLDRKVDVATAITTSIAAVEANPRVMMLWGLTIAGLLALGSLPLLVGLVVVMPVLGHASWHLYRKVVEA